MKIFDNVRNPLVLLMSLIFCVTSSGCDTSYDSMVKEYNSCYTVKTVITKVPEIGSQDFDQYSMIPEEEYNIPIGLNFAICAPAGGVYYKWTLAGPTFDGSVEVGDGSRVFDYCADSSFKIGEGYELTLDVQYSQNRNYQDKTTLVFEK